jgi:hypothetical protein
MRRGVDIRDGVGRGGFGGWVMFGGREHTCITDLYCGGGSISSSIEKTSRYS